MITLDRLKTVVIYDENTGRFYWTGAIRCTRPGEEAGSFDAHGYGQVRIDGAVYKEHRLVWFYKTGSWPAQQIDHIDQNRRNNRFDNLRAVDNTENHKNRPKQRNNTSGAVGVSFVERVGRYRAYIQHAGKRIHIGYFADIESAKAARKAANDQYGYHSNHGAGVSVPKRALKKQRQSSA